MDRLLVALALIAVAVVVALIAQRRRPAPSGMPTFRVPEHVDRADFARPEAAWLVVVFTSATCETCAATRTVAAELAGPEVAVDEVEVGRRPELHARYGVDAVPLSVLVDGRGVVREHAFGLLDGPTFLRAMGRGG